MTGKPLPPLDSELRNVLRLIGKHFKATDNLKACRPASYVMMALMAYEEDPSEANMEKVREKVALLWDWAEAQQEAASK